MKKNVKIIIGIIIILLIILCIVLYNVFKLDVIKCSNQIKEDTYTINYKYEIYHKNDVVKKIKLEREVISDNNTVLNFFEKNYKDEFKKYNKDYGGYKVDSNVDTKKHKMLLTAELDMKKVNINKLKGKNTYLKDDIKNKKLYVDGVYKLYNLNN